MLLMYSFIYFFFTKINVNNIRRPCPSPLFLRIKKGGGGRRRKGEVVFLFSPSTFLFPLFIKLQQCNGGRLETDEQTDD